MVTTTTSPRRARLAPSVPGDDPDPVANPPPWHQSITGRWRPSLTAGGTVTVRARAEDGTTREFTAIARIDTPEELVAFRHGGILPYVVRQLAKS